jgi:hypothetical protein
MALTNQEYLETSGLRCPNCEKDGIEGSSITVAQGFVWQDCRCNICNAEWTDMYKLAGYEHLTIPTPPPEGSTSG